MYIDNKMIEKIIATQPYTKKAKHENIDTLEDGITKDLINLGIDLGKVFVCYYGGEFASELSIEAGKEFYACLVTIEETFINTPEYKKRIIQIAQSYSNHKLGNKILIDEKRVKLLSVSDFEASIDKMSVIGIGKCLDEAPILNNNSSNQIKEYLIEECKKGLFNPLCNDIISYSTY